MSTFEAGCRDRHNRIIATNNTTNDTISAAISIMLLLSPVVFRVFSIFEYFVPSQLWVVRYMCSDRSKDLSLHRILLYIVGAFAPIYISAAVFNQGPFKVIGYPISYNIIHAEPEMVSAFDKLQVFRLGCLFIP